MNGRRDAATAVEGVASPCTKVCTIDQASGLCAGCARTLDEIARWSAFSDDEKRAVLAELPARRAPTGQRGADGRR
jgi:predicted Fe-S protein YdhL (DUF1289 family)